MKKAEYPTFVNSLYDVLYKHHFQRYRVAHSTNTTHKYRANPNYTASRHATTSSSTPTHFRTSDRGRKRATAAYSPMFGKTRCSRR